MKHLTILLLISTSVDLLILPNFRLIKDFGIVTSLCSLITESTISPEPSQYEEPFSTTRSLSTIFLGILLDMKAIIICSNLPVSEVKQRAGLTLEET